jgi:hypothetical protein
MGKSRIQRLLSLLLATSAFMLSAEEAKAPLGLEYSIRADENGSLLWEIIDPGGKPRELAAEEKFRLLRERYFPEAVAKAQAGKAPEVWIVGFFYLDERIAEPDPEKAEAAFRRGLDLGRPDGMLYLADFYHRKSMSRDRDSEERARHLDRAEALTRAVLEAGRGEAAGIANTLASVHLFGW